MCSSDLFMKQVQVCIVGGGCVGLTLALGLAKANISVAVLDAAPTQAPPSDDYDVTSSDGKRAYSEGFITYTDREGVVCKQVVFNFKINSLKNYIRSSAYTPAGRGKKGAPKQVENVDSISLVEPISVEPTFAV